MYGRHALHSYLIETFQSPNPQLQVGVDRVFHQDRHVYPSQAVGHILHAKRIGGRASAYPKNVNAIFQAKLHMLRFGHLGSHKHASLLFHALEPRQSQLAIALKTSGLGTWFPHARAKHVATFVSQLLGRGHHPLLRLGAARPRQNKGTHPVTGQIQRC